jgi:hypothetical protein
MSDRLLRPSRTSWATWVVINSLASSHKLVRALLSLSIHSYRRRPPGHVQVVLPFKLPVSSATMAPSPTGPGPSKP